jgi:hypothetical protein
MCGDSKEHRMTAVRIAAVALAGLLAAGAALAEKPDHAGKGKGKAQHRPQTHERGVAGPSVTISFPSDTRAVVRDYYASPGHCPPGLAKKRNGCLPPGQAKKWAIGRPLPRDVIWHELPPDLVVKIGLPPQGYKYVRAAADILMIAVGTGLVVDAIEDLGRL